MPFWTARWVLAVSGNSSLPCESDLPGRSSIRCNCGELGAERPAVMEPLRIQLQCVSARGLDSGQASYRLTLLGLVVPYKVGESATFHRV
jgi:hypothetical protein